MKKAITIIAVLLMATQCFAIDVGIAGRAKAISDIANTVMAGRQAGITMSDLIEINHETSADPTDETTKFTDTIILRAFEVPLETTRAGKDAAIEQFTNTYYLVIVKILEEKK